MLIKVLCPHCLGGLVKQTCQHCDGAGCPKCGGCGYGIVPCKTCNGEGELIVEVPDIFREILSTYGRCRLSDVMREEES